MRRRLVFLRIAFALVLACVPAAVAADDAYLSDLPSGDRWISHLSDELLPFWTMSTALGTPLGVFPSTRCDDGSLLDFAHPCAPIAGNDYLLTPALYLVPLSRQTYGYGVAYHLTGDPKYLGYMKAGVDYIRQNAIDPAGGMRTLKDLTNAQWGPAREFRDAQQLGYGLLGMAFYYYLTRDDAVLQDILAIKSYIFANYWNAQAGTMQWTLAPGGYTAYDSKQLVSDLDQMNTYLVLLTPILPEPYQTEWKQSLTSEAHSMLGTFYSPRDNLFFTQADTAADRDLAQTGVDAGHTSKALWMLRWTGMLTGDSGLANFAEANARRHLDRMYLAPPDDGSWAQGLLPGGALDKDKNWWVYCELDQLSASLALSDVAAGKYLPRTNNYWFQYFVDHQYGDVWNGVNYGTNTPQREYPKSWQWKSMYHDFEHALVGYITSRWLLGQPATLHYAFTKEVDASTIHPYYFAGTAGSISTQTGDAGSPYQTVSFNPPAIGSAPAVAVTSAASYLPGPASPGSIVSGWGPHLGSGMGSTQVTVTDSAGVVRTATVFYDSPLQMNFEIPPETALGPATVSIAAADGTISAASLQIVTAAPGIFQLNGQSLAAANVVRVKPDHSQVIEAMYQLDGGNNVIARPIDLGTGDPIYLSLYGTGWRNAANVTVTVGAQNVPVLYAGAQGAFTGLDQVNFGPLPVSLAGSARANIVLTADGQTANPVEIAIR